MRDLFDDFLAELRKREATARGQAPGSDDESDGDDETAATDDDAAAVDDDASATDEGPTEDEPVDSDAHEACCPAAPDLRSGASRRRPAARGRSGRPE